MSSISLLVPAVGVGLVPLQPCEHGGGDIELDRKLVVRDGFDELVDLAPHGIVIDRVERPMQVVLQKQPDHRVRRNQIDLEAAVRGDFSLLLSDLRNPGTTGSRCRHRTDFRMSRSCFRCPRLQPVARASGRGRVQPKHLVRFLQRRVVREHRLEMRDPVDAFTGLAIGDAQEARPPSAALTVTNTSCALARGTLPTRWTLRDDIKFIHRSRRGRGQPKSRLNPDRTFRAGGARP